MHLKSLHIKNFRCFKDYTIEFAPGVTVLFGKNGSGKTTLIHAMHKALSFLMYSEEVKEKAPKGKKPKVLEIKTIRLRNPYPSVEGFSEFDGHYEGTKSEDYEIDIEANADFTLSAQQTVNVNWHMTGTAPKFALKRSGYRTSFLQLYGCYQTTEPTPQRPLLAYYSDGFPHNTLLNQSKSTEKKKLDFHLSKNYEELGFTDWNQEKGFTNVWLERLRNRLGNMESSQREKAVFEGRYRAGLMTKENYEELASLNEDWYEELRDEVEAITQSMREFTRDNKIYEVADLGLSLTDRNEVCIITPTMERHNFSTLPAGYKRMLYIALDLAYRSYMLSGRKSTDVPGIAIIDEIDLHLHPELEQVVLQRFMKTFPRVQFVVSTHSPLVLTGIETIAGNNLVLQMAPGSNGPDPLQDVHGIDYNLMLEENMGVTKRKPEIQMMFDEAWKKVSEKDILGAKRVIEHLESTTPSDQTELVRLRAIVNRLEVIGR